MNDFLKANKTYIALLLVGLFLLLVPSMFNFSSNTSKTEEQRFKEVIQKVQGIGEIEVMVNYTKEGDVDGAVIVAEGVENVDIKKQITDAASTAFGISAYKVQVLSYKQEVK